MPDLILPIVEGIGETESVPLLLRRILAESGELAIGIARAYRVKRLRIVRAGELERTIQTAKAVRGGVAGILLILDSDDDDPGVLTPELRSRGAAVAAGPFGVVSPDENSRHGF